MLKAAMGGILLGSGDSRSSWKKKLEILRATSRGLQTFRSRSVLQVRVICPHFSDEETEAETFLEAEPRWGSSLSLEGETIEPQVWVAPARWPPPA